jgi:YfiH family protein
MRTAITPASRDSGDSGILCENMPPQHGWRAGFSLRGGGVSTNSFSTLNLGLHVGDDPRAVLENRRRFFATRGVTGIQPVFAQQVHSSAVALVGWAESGRGAESHADAMPGVDALVTRERGLPLICLSADCLLLALCDAHAGVLGVLHAGWRGMALGVIENTLTEMLRAGATPERVRVFGGPSIGPCCFEVGSEVPAALGGAHARPAEHGKWMYDLRAAAAERLARMNVDPGQTTISPACTCCEEEKYFSHRRATRAGQAACGRMALLAWLE